MENNRYGLLLFLIISLHTTAMAATVQEKQAMYHQLASLENQRKLLLTAYEKAMQDALNEDERNIVEQEYVQQIKDISQQIEERKRMLEATTNQELLWSGAKFFGATALLGLLAYNIFTAARVPHKEQSISSSIKTMSDTSSEALLSEILQLSQQDSVIFDHQKDFQKIPQESSDILPPQFQSIDPKEVPALLQAIKMPLTPQEKALYELRYKNLRDTSAFYFFMFVLGLQVAGPIGLPIELILFGIPALSGAGAAYYKAKLYP